MESGTVKFFNEEKGYGFIKPEGGGPDVFVHVKALHKAAIDTLRTGDYVTFDVEEDDPRKGAGRKRATNLSCPARPDHRKSPT